MEKRETPDLSELERIFAVADNVQKVDHDNKLGLDALVILLWLTRQGASSPKRISSEFGFSPSKTTRQIERLLRYRLVDETLDSADLRKSIISVVPKGLKLVSDLEHSDGVDSVDVMLDFFVCFWRVVSQYNECHKGSRLTDGKARLLMVAHFSGQPMTVSDLCSSAKLRQPSVSMMVKWLIGKGLMANDEGSFGDGRTRNVRIAHDGEDAVCEILNWLRRSDSARITLTDDSQRLVQGPSRLV